MRPPLVVPGLMKLPDALAALVSSKNELACVIDEYGGFTGVITLEDLGEELVGELSDEHDGETAFVSEQIDERSWRVAGHLQLDELERILGHELPEGDFETLGGLLVATRGGLIDVGETIGIVLPESGAELAEGKDVPLILIAEVIEREKYVPTMVRIDIREQVTDEEATADNASADDEGNQQ
jgi:CBS domain containing-hemolysin-like protein